MSPRQRRLNADFEKLRSEFTNHPFISFEYNSNEGLLPERYFVNFNNIKGIKLAKDSTPDNKVVEIIENHTIEIYLHIDYPRLKPQSYILTDIFHPNFRMASPHDICIGDYWASGETLADIIYQVGEMIQYQNYNVTSPLNGVAAKWARENENMFPIDIKDLRQGEVEIELKKKRKVDIKLK
jgi:ubiquitin-protein ligase